MAAATRAIAVASNTTASCLLFKRPLLLKRSSLCFKNPSGAKRLFSCRAIYNPEALQIKQEGQPETLDYRVFLVDNSSKKVLSLFPSKFAY
jgi:inorganic pyrophosphatase